MFHVRANRFLLAATLALVVFIPVQGVRAEGAVALIDAHTHLGVASCSNSVCHGAAQPFKDAAVLRNEFATWQEFDPHSKSYARLQTPAARSITAKLGLGDPTTVQVCLDCHTENVPVARRGERFQIDDGVGCEACHGGAADWIASHAAKNARHADNLGKGLYPTDQPLARARLCLSCHVGTPDRAITHRIMGAGHPRLSFELDTFTWLHPHYRIDDGWVARKGAWSGVRDWALGQGVAADSLLAQLSDPKFANHGLFPELVLFDCNACHKRMSDHSWAPRQGTGLGPGTVRLNDANLVMFRHVMTAIDPAASKVLLDQTRALHRATTESREATMAATKRLRATLTTDFDRVAAFDFDAAALDRILASIIADGKRGEYRDFAAAEQAGMALQSLLVAYENAGTDATQIAAMRSQLDLVYETIKSDSAYSMSRFVAALQGMRNAH
ncbi:MAG: multiheme c-type cytochrome [Dokdonella sp.]